MRLFELFVYWSKSKVTCWSGKKLLWSQGPSQQRLLLQFLPSRVGHDWAFMRSLDSEDFRGRTGAPSMKADLVLVRLPFCHELTYPEGKDGRNTQVLGVPNTNQGNISSNQLVGFETWKLQAQAPPQVHEVVRRHYNTVYRTGLRLAFKKVLKIAKFPCLC